MAAKEGYAVFIGSPCVDEYYRLKDTWPPFGDKAVAEFSGNVPGGMIANAACVCAGYGVKTYCFDVMGTSETTQFLADDMEENRVDMSRVIRLDDFTDAKCIIFQKEGERSIIVVPASPYQHTLSPAEKEFLCGAAYMFTTLPNLSRFAGYEELLRDMKAAGVKIIFDSEATTHRPGWENSLQYAHTIFFNEFSVEVFAEGSTEKELFAKLFGWGITNIVVTLGPLGCRVVTAGGEDFTIPAYDVPKVDTTGAGDTFNSSFTMGMLKGWPVKEAAFFANAAANMAIGVQGPRGGITSEDKVRAFIAAHADEIAPDY